MPYRKSKFERAYDPLTRMHHERTTFDVEHIAEDAKMFRNLGTNGWSRERNYRQVASIPANIYWTERQKAGITHESTEQDIQKFLRQLMADYRIFMTVDAFKTDRKHIIH